MTDTVLQQTMTETIEDEQSKKEKKSHRRTSLERKEQKRKVKEIMKLDKGTRLAKEELREKRKMRSSVLDDLLEEQRQERDDILK